MLSMESHIEVLRTEFFICDRVARAVFKYSDDLHLAKERGSLNRSTPNSLVAPERRLRSGVLAFF